MINLEYKNYKKLKIQVDKGVAFVTIDNPPINLMDLQLIAEMGIIRRVKLYIINYE